MGHIDSWAWRPGFQGLGSERNPKLRAWPFQHSNSVSTRDFVAYLNRGTPTKNISVQ